MLTLISSPANNERGPRYMEKALAAIHQAGSRRLHMTLAYGSLHGQLGLYLHCPNAIRELVVGPMAANYPECDFTVVENESDQPGLERWSVEIDLVPELFPILRHAQFEDALNRNYADPLSSLLRAIKPDDTVDCRVEIVCAPASKHRCHDAVEAVKRLDRAFFREHHRFAGYFARNITGRSRLPFSVSWLLGRLTLRTATTNHAALDTSTSRLHEREEDLQSASDKLAGTCSRCASA